VEWHRDYDDPGSLLSRRGELVQEHLCAEFDRAPAGNVRLISLCAGQGRDVIGVLIGHPRRDDVRARLIELDERNVALARQAAQDAGLLHVEVVQADAGITDACADAVPAQIVVACGIFGNITDGDIRATVAALGGPGRSLGPGDLEVAVLSRRNGRRTFRRIEEAEIGAVLGGEEPTGNGLGPQEPARGSEADAASSSTDDGAAGEGNGSDPQS